MNASIGRSFPPKQLLLPLFLLGVWLGASQSQVVWAQTSKLYTQEARQLTRQGQGLVRSGQYKRALIKFNTALELIKKARKEERNVTQQKQLQQVDVRLTYMVGRTYQLDKQPGRAFIYYDRCTRQDMPSDVSRQVRKYLEEILPQVRATVTIRSSPPLTEVRLSDSQGKWYSGRTPFTCKPAPGKATILIKRKRFQPIETTVLISPRQYLTRSFLLQPKNQQKTNKDPARRNVTIQRGTSPNQGNGTGSPMRPQPVPASKAVSIPTTLVWILGGVAVAGLAGGIGLSVVGQGKIAEANQLIQDNKGLPTPKNPNDPNDPLNQQIQQLNQQISDLKDSGNNLTTLGVVGFVVAGVAAAGAVVVFFLPRRLGPSTQASIQPEPARFPSTFVLY